MTRVILIRHAEVETSWKLVCYGAMDVELSDAGTESCRQLVENWPRQIQPQRIYHSGLRRTETLARMIGGLFPTVPLLCDERLRERDYGQWQGKTWDEVYDADPNFHDLVHRPDEYRPPGGETTTEMQARVMNWFQAVANRTDLETIVAISHSGPIASLAGFCMGIHPTKWDPWMLKNLDALAIDFNTTDGTSVVTKMGLVGHPCRII
jgi:broad specificity phosphatase PhoE